MNLKNEAKDNTAALYNAAASYYDAPPLAFRDAVGRETVWRLGLQSGDRVLDVCCGAGASALAAADVVAPMGYVLAIDLAENLLALAREKAVHLGIGNITFHAGDFEKLNESMEAFDAVMCVLGLCFRNDNVNVIRQLWRWLRPDGKLAITTWAPGAFEPARAALCEAIREVRPDITHTRPADDLLADEQTLRERFTRTGIADFRISAETQEHTVRAIEDWWTIVLGSSYSGFLVGLTTAEAEEVRKRFLQRIEAMDAHTLKVSVLYATATKQASELAPLGQAELACA